MSTFWVDKIVSDISHRSDKQYLVTDYKTPSGKIHVGALRGVILHDVISKGLKHAQKSAEFWYGFDDFDPMDDISANLKAEFGKYMGQPLYTIPSPEPGYENYAQYFAKDFEAIYRSLGVNSKTVWASEMYKSGKYNEGIKLVLDNADKIRQIYKSVSGSEKPNDWYPFQVVCPKCGKLGTTKVYGWGGEKVKFECVENLVTWAKGCGYKGEISPFDGNGKMPYKTETAVKWFSFGTSVELAGKDHYTKGGTFDVAKQIAKEIFNINPAYGFGYEFFLVGGKKMSSSKGIGSTAEDISKILPPEVLRFLFIRTRPKRTIDFDPQGDTIPRLYDEYDRCIDEYLSGTESDFAKAYEYSKIGAQKPPQYRLRFSKIAYLLQMPRVDIFEYAAEEKTAPLTETEITEIKNRITYAKKWLSTFAPESFKFVVQEKLPAVAKDLSKTQLEFLEQIAKLLEQKKYSGQDLHQEIHNLKTKTNIEPRDAFSAIYLSILGKDSGPQAGWLLASLDRDFVVNRFLELLK